jgi:hypothetical protein
VWALGLTGSQEKAGLCPNKMLALYNIKKAGFAVLLNSAVAKQAL